MGHKMRGTQTALYSFPDMEVGCRVAHRCCAHSSVPPSSRKYSWMCYSFMYVIQRSAKFNLVSSCSKQLYVAGIDFVPTLQNNWKQNWPEPEPGELPWLGRGLAGMCVPWGEGEASTERSLGRSHRRASGLSHTVAHGPCPWPKAHASWSSNSQNLSKYMKTFIFFISILLVSCSLAKELSLLVTGLK